MFDIFTIYQLTKIEMSRFHLPLQVVQQAMQQHEEQQQQDIKQQQQFVPATTVTRI